MAPVLPAGGAAPAAAPAPASRPAGPSFAAVLERLSGSGAPAAEVHRAGPAAHQATGIPPRSAGIRLLEEVDRARARLDAVLAVARSGRTFTAQELLGLQAEAYRTVQTVDLGVKLVEQGAQSLRQALSTQV